MIHLFPKGEEDYRNPRSPFGLSKQFARHLPKEPQMYKILPLAAVGLLALSLRAEEKAVKLDAKSLEGKWTITKGEHDGKALPPDHFTGSVVTFTKTKIFGTDKNTKEFFSADYTVDTSSTPAAIKMTAIAPKKEKSDGIIEMNGDTVRLCYALPGGETPKKFEAGVKQNCFTLKRIGKAK
jgi:uncharacterized protein (TIGR03067 family)